MKSGLTEIVVVLDESGSMGPVTDDTIGGFNTFLSDQKKLPGEARLSLTLFDAPFLGEIRYNGVPICTVPELTKISYCPGGMTALLDAIGETIRSVGERLASTPEEDRPERVLFVIITDGEENSSSRYTKDQINKMISTQTNDYSWEFLFLGANQDAIKVADGYGIRGVNAANYSQDDHGTVKAFVSLSASAQSYRSTGKTDEWGGDV
jgi:hypothetical protein